MQKNITITLSATSIFADAPDDLDTASSTATLIDAIETALAPEYNATVVISQRDGTTVVEGIDDEDEIGRIKLLVDGIWERGEWIAYQCDDCDANG
jgi:hypothetical protein